MKKIYLGASGAEQKKGGRCSRPPLKWAYAYLVSFAENSHSPAFKIEVTKPEICHLRSQNDAQP